MTVQTLTAATQSFVARPQSACGSCASHRDEVEIGGQRPAQNLKQQLLTAVQGEPHLATTTLTPDQVANPEALAATTNVLIEQMDRFPTFKAVVGVMPAEGDKTKTLVISRPDAVNAASLEGAFEVNQRFGSSDLIKEMAGKYPVSYEKVQQVDSQGRAHVLRLPGALDEADVAQALDEGRTHNQYEQLEALVKGLPQGERVVILVGGPSAAGKSTLIREIQKFAGDRPVTTVMGDMYFKDVDQPGYPQAADGSYYWDHADFMDMQKLKEDLSTLVQTGEADLPVYNFQDIRPGGWRMEGVKVTGFREEKPNHVEVGQDSIIVLDSIHATNPAVVEHFEKLGLPYKAVYLDSPSADDRLLRRLVRDYEERGGRTPAETFKIWDLTTFRGETEFIRPTILDLDPARDVFLVAKFPKDLGLGREDLVARADAMAKYGVQPSYPAFSTRPEAMGAFAKAEEARYQAIMNDPAAKAEDRAHAEKGLKLLRQAPGYQQKK